MFEGLVAWASKLVGLWMSALALGTPLPVAQSGSTGTQPGANISSEVLSVATITPVPGNTSHHHTPVTPTPEPEKPKPVDPPVVKPIKPIKCYALDYAAGEKSSWRCRCNYIMQENPSANLYCPPPPPCGGYGPDPGIHQPDVYMCRAPLE